MRISMLMSSLIQTNHLKILKNPQVSFLRFQGYLFLDSGEKWIGATELEWAGAWWKSVS